MNLLVAIRPDHLEVDFVVADWVEPVIAVLGAAVVAVAADLVEVGFLPAVA